MSHQKKFQHYRPINWGNLPRVSNIPKFGLLVFLGHPSGHREWHILGWPHNAGIAVTVGSFRLSLKMLAVLLRFASCQQTVSRRSPFASQTHCRMTRQTIITSQPGPDVTLWHCTGMLSKNSYSIQCEYSIFVFFFGPPKCRWPSYHGTRFQEPGSWCPQK